MIECLVSGTSTKDIKQYVDLTEKKCLACPVGFSCNGTFNVMCNIVPVTDFVTFDCVDNVILVCK